MCIVYEVASIYLTHMVGVFMLQAISDNKACVYLFIAFKKLLWDTNKKVC